MKSKVIISLFETVRLSVSISLRNPYNSLNSIKEMKLSMLILPFRMDEKINIKISYNMVIAHGMDGWMDGRTDGRTDGWID